MCPLVSSLEFFFNIYLITETDGYGSTIQAAVDQFAQHTCIIWKPRENEERWVTFVKKLGCV